MSQMSEAIRIAGGVDAVIEGVRGDPEVPESQLASMRLLLEEEVALGRLEDALAGTVPAGWLVHSVLYARCFELCERFSVDPVERDGTRMLVSTYRLEGYDEAHVAITSLDAALREIDPQRLLGALLIQSHLTIAQVLGVLPPGEGSSDE